MSNEDALISLWFSYQVYKEPINFLVYEGWSLFQEPSAGSAE